MKMKNIVKMHMPKSTKNGPGLTNSFVASSKQILADNESPGPINVRKTKQKINNLNKTSSSKNFKNLNKSKIGTLLNFSARNSS